MLREQKRALAGAAISGVILIATILLIILSDPYKIFEKDFLELIYLGIILLGALVYGVLVFMTRERKEDEKMAVDERDLYIASRALVVQLRAVLISMALWCVILVRIYIGQGGIPVPLMYLMYVGVVNINFLVRSIYILRVYNKQLESPTKGN
jgi:hypothetical protein